MVPAMGDRATSSAGKGSGPSGVQSVSRARPSPTERHRALNATVPAPREAPKDRRCPAAAKASSTVGRMGNLLKGTGTLASFAVSVFDDPGARGRAEGRKRDVLQEGRPDPGTNQRGGGCGNAIRGPKGHNGRAGGGGRLALEPLCRPLRRMRAHQNPHSAARTRATPGFSDAASMRPDESRSSSSATLTEQRGSSADSSSLT